MGEARGRETGDDGRRPAVRGSHRVPPSRRRSDGTADGGPERQQLPVVSTAVTPIVRGRARGKGRTKDLLATSRLLRAASPPPSRPSAAQCRRIGGREILLYAVGFDRYGARLSPTNRSVLNFRENGRMILFVTNVICV